ncbi:MAG: hypothetical protein N2234_03110 [Planctomycetota bacterium]|nr:hypothetical protein [Planctomycetota bacterium]
MGKFLKFIVVLAVLVIGGLYGHYRYLVKTDPNAPKSFFAYLSSLFEEKTREVAEKPKGEPVKPVEVIGREEREGKDGEVRLPEKKEGREKTPASGVVEVSPKPIVDVEKVNYLRQEAKRLYEAAEFDKSQQKFKELCDVLYKGGESNSSLYAWAMRYMKRSMVFSALLSHIQRSELASGKNIYVLKMETGAELWVCVKKEDEDKVTIEKEGGIVSEIPRDRIVEMVGPKKPEEYKNYLSSKFEERKKALPATDYAGRFVHLVVFAKKYGLDDKITPLMEEIFSVRKSEILVQMFVPKGDTDEYVVALLEGFERDADAREYRRGHSWKVAARPPTPRPEESTASSNPPSVRTPSEVEPVKPNPPEEPPLEHPETGPVAEGNAEVRPLPPSAGSMTESERREYEEARRLVEEVRGLVARAMNIMGTPECFRLGKTAMEKIKHAQKIVVSLRSKYPNDEALEMMEGDIAEMVRIVEHIFPAK